MALRLALAAVGPTHAPVGSFNNHWGVPLTLARMPAGTHFGVFEIGMNHAGEIRPLTKLVRPHAAIVTTVEPVHIAFFQSEAAIATMFDGQLYVAMGEEVEGGRRQLRLWWKPLVTLIWLGGALVALGEWFSDWMRAKLR